MSDAVFESAHFSNSRAGFSLLEMLVVTAIIIFVTSIGIGAYQRFKNQSTVATCQSNLRNIGQANQIYLNAYQSLPSEFAPLLTGLRDYGLSPKVMVCPADKRTGSTDSYSVTYVRRRRFDDPQSVVISCSRHYGGKKVNLLTLKGTVRLGKLFPVTFTASSGASRELTAGETFGTGELRPARGGAITISNFSVDPTITAPQPKPQNPMFVAGYEQDGTARSVLFVPSGAIGLFDAQPSPSSVIEVVLTQLAVEARGGRASILTEKDTDTDELVTTVTCTAGRITVRHRDIDRKLELKTNASYSAGLSLNALK